MWSISGKVHSGMCMRNPQKDSNMHWEDFARVRGPLSAGEGKRQWNVDATLTVPLADESSESEVTQANYADLSTTEFWNGTSPVSTMTIQLLY